MQEKTLGQVAYEARWPGDEGFRLIRPVCQQAWAEAAQAVIAEDERRRWRPIETAPKDRECLVGRKSWTNDAWFWGKCEWHPDVEWRDWTHWAEVPVSPEGANEPA